VFTGEPPSPAEIESLSIQLLPQGAGGVRLSTNGGRVGVDSRFTFAGVPADTYYLFPYWISSAAGSRWTITRAVANGQDAFEAPLRVEPGTAIDLAVTFTDRPTVLSGVFQDRRGRAATDNYVLVFSADRRYWAPGSRRIRMTRPATDGAFEIRGLPAGEYLVGALADLEPGEWHDPTLLEQLSPLAIKVALREGQSTTQDVRTGN
jgi:hypothetical protein